MFRMNKCGLFYGRYSESKHHKSSQCRPVFFVKSSCRKLLMNTENLLQEIHDNLVLVISSRSLPHFEYGRGYVVCVSISV
jgi:hypothetical protein